MNRLITSDDQMISYLVFGQVLASLAGTASQNTCVLQSLSKTMSKNKTSLVLLTKPSVQTSGSRLAPSNTSLYPLLQRPEETRSLSPISLFPSSSNLYSAHGSGVTFALLKQTFRLQLARPARTHTYTYSKASFDVNRWLRQDESHSVKHEVILQGTNTGKSAPTQGVHKSARRFIECWGIYNENDTAKGSVEH